MAVTIGELLGEVRDHLEVQRAAGVDSDAAVRAAGGLAPIARALDLLYGDQPHDRRDDGSRPSEVTALATACSEAARAWPGQGGRVVDLLGAAGAAIDAHSATFTHQQRWALSEALAMAARRCVDTARQFPAYHHIPQLREVRAAAVACERRATLLPATSADRAALDRMIPDPRLATRPGERIVDAAAALHLAVTSRGHDPRLCMAEVLMTINAAHLATAHAASRLAATAVPTTAAGQFADAAGNAAPRAWRATRLECASFDDGTKLRPPDGSAVAGAAARLGRNLLDHLGPASAPASDRQGGDLAVLATLQTVTGLLPEVAAGLGGAARTWIENRQLWAPERRLLSYENRNDAVTSTDRVARVEYVDLEPLQAALRLAATLTGALATELAVELAHHDAPGAPRRPHVAAAHTAGAASTAEHLSMQAQSAHDALRRAQTMYGNEFALPTTPRPAPRR